METRQERDATLFKSAIPMQPQLLHHARYLARNEADAQDLVQDTFERALRAAKVPARSVEVRPWLIRVLTNLWIDQVRARRTRRLVPFHEGGVEDFWSAEDPTPEGPERWDLSALDLTSALAEVPEPFQSTYRDYAITRRSYLEIARDTGISMGTVGTRILRARRCLRRILEARIAAKMSPTPGKKAYKRGADRLLSAKPESESWGRSK